MSSTLLGGDRDTYRLVNLTPPSDDEDDLDDDLEYGGKRDHVPDLQLIPPAAAAPQSSSLSTTTSRIKRKIRLKRKDRDRLSREPLAGTNSAGGGNGILSPTPSNSSQRVESYFCCCCLRRNSPSLILTLTQVVIVGLLVYFTATSHVKLSDVSLEMENVLEERNELKEKYRNLHSQMQAILSNQTSLKLNVTRDEKRLLLFSTQLASLNGSLEAVRESLQAAPELKTLPGDVQEVKEDVAKFGVRITEMEKRLSESSLIVREEAVEKTANELKSGLESLHTRVEKMSAVLSDEIQKGLNRSAKTWEHIASLQSKVDRLNGQMADLKTTD